MKKYELEHTYCPVCDSTKFEIYIDNAKELYIGLDEYFNLCKCEGCGHYYLNPRPTKETIGYFYPDGAGYYQPTNYDMSIILKNEKYKKYLNLFYKYKLESTCNPVKAFIYYLLRNRKNLEMHLPVFVEDGNLLDIGCAYGNYMKKMELLGWNVYGSEINTKAVEYARENLNNGEIQNVFFEDYEHKDEFFDAINMQMVLEHTYDPVYVLKKVNSLLKKNGQLMLSVPDLNGFEFKLFRKYAYGLQVPQHLHHFCPKTISYILKQSGFKVEQIIHQNYDRDLVASARLAGNLKLHKILSNSFLRKTLVHLFVSILSRLNKTSRMSVYARKV